MGQTFAFDTQPELRSVLADPFRVVYELHADDVTITTVLHTSMDIEAELRRLIEEG
jgi:plasmid stabilization system protein ParE